MTTDIFTLDIKSKNVLLFTFTIRQYDDEPNWGIRRLSWPIADRFAIDLGNVSLIFELWFIRIKGV